ncbi:conserved Plasmodium protein, unknown function [Plasmodium gallinaceum]|uniref:Uncharacterized protein n=1 Tax=Plasmodium gallinaceum TaxID=5849 RepID=A0A1J1GZ19_PLAGA|nr:conserved Plasmodium protein, unknown function [Plasmodium gallinaceum]CRG97709.1 conserved Plasmodium protein, unknown function [Plasmodium gallinaceum]
MFKYDKIKKGWRELSRTAKVVYGCFFFNMILLMGITTRRHLANKKAVDFYTNKILDSNNENEDWHCYNVAKQYRYECAYLNEEEMEQLQLCKKLDLKLENCRNKLYDYIKEDTPAMKNIPHIINKPIWLKDPVWFQNLQNKK